MARRLHTTSRVAKHAATKKKNKEKYKALEAEGRLLREPIVKQTSRYNYEYKYSNKYDLSKLNSSEVQRSKQIDEQQCNLIEEEMREFNYYNYEYESIRNYS